MLSFLSEQEKDEFLNSRQLYYLNEGYVNGINFLDIRFKFHAKEIPDTELITCFGEIRLVFPKSYPDDVPSVIDLTGHTNKDFSHFNHDKTLCLGSTLEIFKSFSRKPTLLGFLENLVFPFYYSFFFFKLYGKAPFGELSHGEKGVYESYSKLFETYSINLIIQYLECLKKPYRGHRDCFCGSNKKLRLCHGDKVKLNIKIPIEKLDKDIELLRSRY